VVTHDEGEPETDGSLGSEDEDAESDGEDGAASDRFDRWRKESALGVVGTGIARGFHAVFAPRVDEVVIVASVPGDPPDADQRVRVVLDPDDPTKSVAIMPETPAEPVPPGQAAADPASG
jgi:hypothetical protein